jgi:putative sigma-54 modulation protein
MNVELHSRHLPITEQVRDYVERKIGRLDRYLPDIQSTRVDLDRRLTHSQGEVHSAQVTAWVNGTVLRAEELHADLYAAIDLAAEKIHRQIERYKGKRLHRWHDRVMPEVAPLAAEEAEAEEAPALVVSRRKRFPIYSMSEAEAVEQFELLGHDFFIFQDADRGAIHVLYRRRGGELGLIEPELA